MNLREMFSCRAGSTAFMPYLCCGDPSPEFTVKLAETLVASGADALELGIPFSDPIADGRTIQWASSRAIANGMRPGMAPSLISQIRKRGITVPLIVMTYYNLLYAKGVAKALASLRGAGAEALIVPDAPLEESGPLGTSCGRLGIDLIQLATPNCTGERLRKLEARTTGMLYAISVLGVTGAREEVSMETLAFVKRLKRSVRSPIAVGFGISRPRHARLLSGAGADGIIVGSALVDLYSKHFQGGKLDDESALRDVADFASAMKRVLR